MKRAAMVLGVVVVFLPMFFVVWMLLAASWPRMDGLTQHLPVGMKRVVVTAIVNMNGNGKQAWLRAEKLDQQGAEKQAQAVVVGMTALVVPPGSVSVSEISRVDGKIIIPDQVKKSARELKAKAQNLEQAHDYCGAEEIYTRAASGISSSNYYWYAQGMGRTGLLCGDLVGARAGLETSLEMADRYLAENSGDEDGVAGTEQDMLQAREYLIVVYDRQKEKALSTTMCKVAHPAWQKCGCALKDAKVTCFERK